MEPNEMQAALNAAVDEVLETMCFSFVLSSSETDATQSSGSEALAAWLRFDGAYPGEFRLDVPLSQARSLGSGFLGTEEDEVSDSQAAEVVCELANMFCGSALSRLHADTIFHLSHPEILAGDFRPLTTKCGVTRAYELENGSITASLNFSGTL